MASATNVISECATYKAAVKSGAIGTIGPKDIIIDDPNNQGYVTIMGTGASEGDSDETFLGVATKLSTDTVGADGEVYFQQPVGGGWMELEMKAHTPGNLARALVGTLVISGDGTKGQQTIDENDETKGVFLILDPFDGKFDTTNGRMRVALTVRPWGASAIRA